MSVALLIYLITIWLPSVHEFQFISYEAQKIISACSNVLGQNTFRYKKQFWIKWSFNWFVRFHSFYYWWKKNCLPKQLLSFWRWSSVVTFCTFSSFSVRWNVMRRFFMCLPMKRFLGFVLTTWCFDSFKLNVTFWRFSLFFYAAKYLTSWVLIYW